MSIWEMAGVAAYPFTFALFESLLILLGLLIAAVILPEKIYRKWFVSQSALIVFFATIWASLIQIYGQEWGVWSTRGAITLLPLALVIGISAFLNAHYMKLQKALESVADRLLILGILYVVIDLVFLVIIIVRNI